MRAPRRINVAKVPNQKTPDSEIDELLGIVCYYYPQYTFKQAEKLPMRRIQSLLKIARQQQAIYYKNMTQIIAAPYSKKGANIRKLLKHYDRVIQTG